MSSHNLTLSSTPSIDDISSCKYHIFLFVKSNQMVLLYNSIEEKKKLEDLILKHDQEKLTVTKTLETKLEEKEQKINKYEARLNELELNSGK